MAIKAGFFGAPCYDLINYVARILAKMDRGVLMIDLSQDQSLLYSISLPDDYDGTEIDYRDVTFSLTEPAYMGMDYEIVLYYFGQRPERICPVDYAFCITSAERQVIAGVADLMERIVYDESAAPGGSGRDIRFVRGIPNMIAMGPGVDARFKYIAMQLDVPRRELVSVNMDEYALACRLACQYDHAFQFRRLSADFRELLYRITSTLCEEELDTKIYKHALKLAERGR